MQEKETAAFYLHKFLKKHILAGLIAVFLTILMLYPLFSNMHGFLDLEANASLGNGFDGIDYQVHVLESFNQHIHEGTDFDYINKGLQTGYMYIIPGFIIMNAFSQPAIVAHNINIIWSFFASLVAMYALAYYFTRNKSASIIAMTLIATLTYRMNLLLAGQGHYIKLHWIILQFLCLELMFKEQKIRYSILLGITSLIVFFTAPLYFVFASFFLVLYILIVYPTEIIKRKKSLLMATCITIVPLLLYFSIVPMWNDQEVRPRDVFDSTPQSLHLQTIFMGSTDNPAFLGYYAYILAGIGAFFAINGKKRRELGVLFLSVMSIALTLGPKSWFHPYTWFYHIWPFAQWFRTPYRAIAFTSIYLYILAAFGYTQMVKKWVSNKKHRIIIMIILCLLILGTYLATSRFFTTLHVVPLSQIPTYAGNI